MQNQNSTEQALAKIEAALVAQKAAYEAFLKTPAFPPNNHASNVAKRAYNAASAAHSRAVKAARALGIDVPVNLVVG